MQNINNGVEKTTKVKRIQLNTLEMLKIKKNHKAKLLEILEKVDRQNNIRPKILVAKEIDR